jgi:hypothetical protein
MASTRTSPPLALPADARQLLEALARAVCELARDCLDGLRLGNGCRHVERIRRAPPHGGKQQLIGPRVVEFDCVEQRAGETAPLAKRALERAQSKTHWRDPGGGGDAALGLGRTEDRHT